MADGLGKLLLEKAGFHGLVSGQRQHVVSAFQPMGGLIECFQRSRQLRLSLPCGLLVMTSTLVSVPYPLQRGVQVVRGEPRGQSDQQDDDNWDQ